LLVEFTAKPDLTNPSQYLYERYQDAYVTYYDIYKDSFKADESLKEPRTSTSSSTGTIDFLFKEFRELATHRIRPILFLDDFNLVFNDFKEPEIEQMRRWRDYTTLILCTEERLYNINPKSSSLFGTFDPQNINGLTLNEAYRLLQEPAERAGGPFPKDDAEFILVLVGLHPGLLIIAGKYLWEIRQQLNLINNIQPLNDQQKNVLKERLRLALTHKFQGYWIRCNDEEKLASKGLAIGKSLLSSDKATITLEAKGIVNLDLGSQYRFFSKLYEEFVEKLSAESIVSPADIPLTPIEDRLYQFLYANYQHPCTFEEIWLNVWNKPGNNINKVKRLIQVTVSRLNIKLRNQNIRINSVSKFGYIMEPSSQKVGKE